LGKRERDRIQPRRSGEAPPNLRLIHDEATIRSNPSFDYWNDRSIEEIVRSLRPETAMPLIVRADGTILDGNTRVWILRLRGYDVESLPRSVYESQPSENFDDDDHT
jgi:hypothetical protein